jgi:hypothetical protein
VKVANRLREQYEREISANVSTLSNGKWNLKREQPYYSVVLRLRSDFLLSPHATGPLGVPGGPISLPALMRNILPDPTTWDSHVLVPFCANRGKYMNHYMVNDQLALGTSRAISAYADTFDYVTMVMFKRRRGLIGSFHLSEWFLGAALEHHSIHLAPFQLVGRPPPKEEWLSCWRFAQQQYARECDVSFTGYTLCRSEACIKELNERIQGVGNGREQPLLRPHPPPPPLGVGEGEDSFLATSETPYAPHSCRLWPPSASAAAAGLVAVSWSNSSFSSQGPELSKGV